MVNDFIYINKHSIEKNPETEPVSGWFKIYYTKQNELTPINKSTYYSVEKFTVFCDDPTIFLIMLKNMIRRGISYIKKGGATWAAVVLV